MNPSSDRFEDDLSCGNVVLSASEGVLEKEDIGVSEFLFECLHAIVNCYLSPGE